MARSLQVRRIDEMRLIGGRPCLDFVNTIHDRFAVRLEDYLADTRTYLEWAVRAGTLTRGEFGRIGTNRVSQRTIVDARQFREHLHALLSARVDNATTPRRSVRALEMWVRKAWRDLRFDLTASGLLVWGARALDARLPLKRIALSALELLCEGAPARLKRCASPEECGWLFYDDTKNNGRRWCAMDTCGVVAKMRRYRRRHRRQK